MGPSEAIKKGLKKSLQYSGRAARPEYWWFLPAGLALPFSWLWLSSPSLFNVEPLIRLLGSAVLISPLVAVTTRRLRDSGAHISGVTVPLTALIGLCLSLSLMISLHTWVTGLWSKGADGPAGFGVMILYWLGVIPLFLLSLRNLVLGLMTGSALFSQMAAPSAQQKSPNR
ncbi:DUF805 domain-containing protein [Sulfitobacter sp.]|uniref:DUF805 domain-containing protein n=1 Tax=Sulfitobacter sp. TaxID=1903071 RepID=UPI003EF95AF0